MLDQSGSMVEEVDGRGAVGADTLSGGEVISRPSKADFATTAINCLIYEMVQSAKFDVSTGKRRKYAYLSILGYNDSVYPLLAPEPMDIPFLGEHQRGTVPIPRDVLDSHTGVYRQVTENRAFWIEPRHQGKTQMAKAFSAARDIARSWLAETPEPGQAPRQECFPPIIINITDAQDNGKVDPVAITHEIQREGTQQGSILIFNCHFTTHMGQSHIFPNSVLQVAHLDPAIGAMIYARGRRRR